VADFACNSLLLARRSGEDVVVRAGGVPSRVVAERDTSWGIEPVPERLRVLGGLDLGLLWGNLGVSLLVIVAGAVLVPALSLPSALLAVLVGCLVGNLMLAAAGAIGAQARVPAMVLMRAPLGERGSYLPTTINVVQCLGWTVFELLVIATAAAALSDELFGFEARWAWTLVFGAAALVMGLLGPIGVVRTVIRRVAVWVVPFAVAYLGWWALTGGGGLEEAWSRPGEGGLSTWQGIDIVVGVTVSWIPLAADYTRFARSPRAAFWGTGIGYFVPDALLLGLGAVVLLTRDVADASALPAAVAAGGLVALLALLALTVAETDEAFANAYSGAVSLQNLFPSASQRLLVVLTTTVGTVGALVLALGTFQSFLFLLGSFFVPLFAVLLADWLASGRRYGPDEVFGREPVRVGLVAAWIAGFAAYQWLSPTGPAWWVDQVQRLDPPAWGIGATLPSFVVSFALALAVAAVTGRVDAGAARA
jgi:NCS1 family nucleobase:cation symporter-1